MKIVIAGAGAIGGYIGARLSAGRTRRRALRPRPRTCGRCRSWTAGDPSPRWRFRNESRGNRRPGLDRPGRRDPPGCEGSRPHGARAAAEPAVRPETVVVSTQNGIPWWYFQNLRRASSNGLRLERVDPGGVIADALQPRRVVGSLAYFATDMVEPGVIRHIEGNRISFGEPDGGSRERVEPDRGGAHRCRLPLSDYHQNPARDLGEAARERRLQSDQRADRRDARRDCARHPDVSQRRSRISWRDRGRRGPARHRAADLDRSAHGGCGEGGRPQDLDAAGSRSRAGRSSSRPWSAPSWSSATPRRADAVGRPALRVHEVARREAPWCRSQGGDRPQPAAPRRWPRELHDAYAALKHTDAPSTRDPGFDLQNGRTPSKVSSPACAAPPGTRPSAARSASPIGRCGACSSSGRWCGRTCTTIPSTTRRAARRRCRSRACSRQRSSRRLCSS